MKAPNRIIPILALSVAPFPELIDRKKCGKMEWKQK